MAFLSSIKNYLYSKKLRYDAKRVAKIPREMLNLKKAKTIGILYDATQTENIIEITKYSEQLKQHGKHIEILGYKNQQIKEEDIPMFFNKKDVSWFSIPNHERVEKFRTTKFDILICAFSNECLPLEYIAATSKATFRVGSFNKSKAAYYELMIHTKENMSLNYLLKQINHFLQVINP